jgi:uncharacterized OB-fold protein
MNHVLRSAPAGAVAVKTDADSEAFWNGLRAGQLQLPHCSAGHRFFPPMPSCPVCGSTDVGLRPAEGRGRLYSWATVHIALDPAFVPDAPYTVVVAELDGGGRLMGRLLDTSDELRAGAQVQLETYEVDGETLPGFRLVQEGP